MSPRDFAKKVAAKINEDSDNENDSKSVAIWFMLFKLSVYMFPVVMPMVVGLNVWLVSEAFANRDWRARGTRFTREEHIEFRDTINSRISRVEDKHEDIYKILTRVDTTMAMLKEELVREGLHKSQKP